MEKRDIIIIGGGASGVACAINLKKMMPNLEITILEQNDKILKKVLKTGNGKCNIGNRNITKEHYNNFSFFEKWVKCFDIDKYFLDLGLIIKEDDFGRLYPHSESANSVVDVLRYEVERLKIEVITNFNVDKIRHDNDNYVVSGLFDIETKVLVIASGSVAQAKTNGYSLLEGLGHSITFLKAGLVPIKVKENVKPLQGIKIKCNARIKEKKFCRSGEILFKEDGISGILSLEMSRYVCENDKIILDLAPNLSLSFLENFLKKYKTIDDLKNLLNGILPKMLAQLIFKKSDNVKKISNKIKNFSLTVDDVYGFNSAQIVLGGVNLNEVNEDFSSKKNKNLYMIGELLDIDGDCGGYNLYFAWLSAYICSQMISKEIFTK